VALTVDERGKLDKETRQTLADKIFQRLDSHEGYEGKRVSLGNIIQMQARHLATFLREERETYEPFVMGW
jgi:CRISPR-associated protein Cas1